MSLWALRRGASGVLLLCLFVHGACDSKKPSPRGGVVRIGKRALQPATPQQAPPTPTVAARDPNDPDQRYQEVILPMLIRHGCFSLACHGPTRGGGFQLSSVEKKSQRSYQEVLKRIDRKDPPKSELVIKVTRQVNHLGGLNIGVDSCDYKRLIAWIGNAPDIECSDDPPPDPARFAREVAPALTALGCVSCHADTAARARLDLSPLARTPAQPELGRLAFASTHPSASMPWASSVIRAANAEDGKHTQKFDIRSCAYRRVYGYVANAPELRCELDTPAAPNKSAESMPEVARFIDQVLPAIGRRGCFEVTCHGGGSGDMYLYGKTAHGSDGRHEYLMLTARVEDLARPEASTFLTTVRNQVPHGGGERLGGKGDCIDEAVVSWLSRQAPSRCTPPPIPGYARFVKEIQPVLDKMTCTQSKCHGASLPKFVLKRYANTPELLMANYKEVLREIDLEFMPFSGVQLRMREPCAYSVVGAWIMNKPRPSCVVHDPDPKLFPRVEGESPMHPKVKVGAPI